MSRFLQGLFLLYMGNRLRKLFSSKSTQKPVALEMAKARKRKRYSLKSTHLWEESPLCRGYKIQYKSEWKNKEGDPVFYKNGEESLLISPHLKPVVPGYFTAYPGGLNIDEYTGEIDVNNSHTGIRYTVEFTPGGHACVTRTTIVIGGVFYQGRISRLSSNEPLISAPYFFGHDPKQDVPTTEVPANKFGFIPPNVRPTANLIGLSFIDEKGKIDLRKTIQSGALGFRRHVELPENGTSKEFKIYYQLKTAQGKEVVNYTTLRIHFFNEEKDIPDELLARINQQHNSIFHYKTNATGVFTNGITLPLLLGIPINWVSEAPWDILSAFLAALSSLLFLINKSDNPLRPPEEVIIG